MTPEIELKTIFPSRSEHSNLDGKTMSPFSWLMQRSDAFAYIILNKDGMVIATNELENPYGKVPFLPNDTDTKGLKFAYLVFKGIHIKGDNSEEPIQFIFMRRMYKASQGSMHYRILEVAIEIFNIQDLCKACNIRLETDGHGKIDSYFTGEGEIRREIKSLASLLYKELAYMIFNTRGTQTAHFKKPNSPFLISFIPASCMTFLKRPSVNAENIDYDDILLEKIRMPGCTTLQTFKREPVSEEVKSKKRANPEALDAPEAAGLVATEEETLVAPEAETLVTPQAERASPVPLEHENKNEKRKKLVLTLINQSELFSAASSSKENTTIENEEQKLQLN